MDKITTAHIPEQIKCTVNVSAIPSGKSHSIQLMLDTGSAVSILPDSIYLHYFKDVPLTEPKLQLVCYLKNHIPVHGCLPAIVTFGDGCVTAEFYIVHKGTPILGRDLLAALNLRVVNGRIDLPQQSTLVVHTPVSAGTQYQVEEKLSCAYGFLHKVKMQNNVMPELRKCVQKDIDSSEWVSPIIVMQKKGGGIRLCVNLREPNKPIVIDSHPLPHIEEVVAELRGAKMFSTLDLQSAYHNVMLHEDSRDLTAFITHEGLFLFKHVPYGLASAPSAFQKMSLNLKNQHGVQCYLDDIIMYGNTSEEHDNNLQSVLNCISTASLQLNRSKCKFRQTELCFLGHTISQAGLKPDPDHILAILNAPPPTDLQTLRSFLGLTSWYIKFIPNYASVIEPLQELPRRSSTLVWTTNAQASFETVKDLIVLSPVLALFSPALPTIVTTDASGYGLGAVLTQLHEDNTERTVAYASRTLSNAERKYSTVKKEALACVWATEKCGGPHVQIAHRPQPFDDNYF
ncbi:unnamed protein product, partial [Eretmochelys imbricata]